uniref:Signal sequence receptor, beta n=1 Tax=Cyprinodon variegatus TaxID=28743 RepID=A0A3Q2CF25_CYPVA
MSFHVKKNKVFHSYHLWCYFVQLFLLKVKKKKKGTVALSSQTKTFPPPESVILGCQYDICTGSMIFTISSFETAAALEVELSDDSFPPEDFGIVSGMLNVKWDRIAPASNVSHTVVLRPLKAGYFNFTSASVSYVAQEGGQVVVGYTSAPGQGGILAQREFDRRFSPHYLDWAAFGVMTLPSIGIPLLLWYSSKRKYDSPKTKKN